MLRQKFRKKWENLKTRYGCCCFCFASHVTKTGSVSAWDAHKWLNMFCYHFRLFSGAEKNCQWKESEENLCKKFRFSVQISVTKFFLCWCCLFPFTHQQTHKTLCAINRRHQKMMTSLIDTSLCFHSHVSSDMWDVTHAKMIIIRLRFGWERLLLVTFPSFQGENSRIYHMQSWHESFWNLSSHLWWKCHHVLE